MGTTYLLLQYCLFLIKTEYSSVDSVLVLSPQIADSGLSIENIHICTFLLSKNANLL